MKSYHVEDNWNLINWYNIGKETVRINIIKLKNLLLSLYITFATFLITIH